MLTLRGFAYALLQIMKTDEFPHIHTNIPNCCFSGIEDSWYFSHARVGDFIRLHSYSTGCDLCSVLLKGYIRVRPIHLLLAADNDNKDLITTADTLTHIIQINSIRTRDGHTCANTSSPTFNGGRQNLYAPVSINSLSSIA
jgi:hypothetical protein